MVVPASQLPDGRNLRKLTTASPTEGGGRLLCSTNNADKTDIPHPCVCVSHTHARVRYAAAAHTGNKVACTCRQKIQVASE